jgi:solute carrier family 25 (peroxisomal adenine nucleotide transporter), member 17
MLSILQKLVKEEGTLALWKGMLASIILVTNPIIQFVVYEWLKKRLSSDGKQNIT